jgi:hypothetical protein
MQIKKHFALLLAFFLLISNSGLAFNVHYCGEKIAAVSSVFSNEEVCDPSNSEEAKQTPDNEKNSCCAKKEITHKKCCSDKEVNLKDNSEKFAFKSISFDFDFFFYTAIFTRTYFDTVDRGVTSQHLYYSSDANAPPLYQLYCQYTFYA